MAPTLLLVRTSLGYIDDPLGSELRVHWPEFTAQELRHAAEAAGFQIDEIATREAYDEIPIRRIYLSAMRR
ncbi:hypothetical protein AB0B45_50445 [Nonomuraea sp. NPDC049152]|uniref:hypothetical protein n=1 Tax=Nonomuraea sp. NPDC049152 TaxID=3154350 RepID=UPI0033E12E7B